MVRLRTIGFVSLLVAGCGGDASAPTAPDLYGDWTATADGVTRGFHFAATDGTHDELAGVADIYLLVNAGNQVQSGHYSVERRLVNGHGTTDALVTQPLSGGGLGGTFGNAILDWTGTTLTISSETASAGELVFTKQ